MKEKEFEIYAQEQGESVSDGGCSKKKYKDSKVRLNMGMEVRNKKQ